MKLKVALLLAIVTCGTPLGMAAPRKDKALAGLTVSVFNDASVGPSVLSTAKLRATAILERAGVRLEWLDCRGVDEGAATAVTDPDCSAIHYPEHLSVRLARRPKIAVDANRETFGQAYLDASGRGNYATIYVDWLTSSSATEIVSTGDLLGYVAAHELGHLLLGRNSHAVFGLMAARWQPAELQRAARGGFYFTDSEADRIRQRFLAQSAGAFATGPGEFGK